MAADRGEGETIMKYQVAVCQAQGVVVGDNAQVVQHFNFYDTPSPSTPMSRDGLLAAVHQASTELRSYHNEIARIHIERAEVADIANWVLNADPQERLGMLLDQPGGGKTVVMRDVLERMETAGVPVLAIKADSLSGVRTRADLSDRLGLPAPVEECAHHLSDMGLFVVLLDQLDALSLALTRDQATLDVLLTTLARLRDLNRVRIVASCRTFDLKNDPRLSAIKVDHKFQLQPLDDSQVNRVLHTIGVDPDRLLPAHRILLKVPLHLRVYVQIAADVVPEQAPESFRTLQDLYEALWRKRIAIIPPDIPSVPQRVAAIYRLVEAMQSSHQLTVPVAVLDEHSEAADYLERVEFIRREGSNWMFLHPTLFDHCYARRFVAMRHSLSQEILGGSQGLFERSQMVQVIAYLRGVDETTYRRELTDLLFAGNLRVHLRLLLIGWFGSLPSPTAGELQIAHRLIQNPPDRSHFLQAVNSNVAWFDLLNEDMVSLLLRSDDEDLNRVVVPYLGSLIQHRTSAVLAHLRPHRGVSEAWDARIAFCLARLDDWQSAEALDLLCDLLVRGRTAGHEGLCLYQMAKSSPSAGCRALRAYLDHRLDYLMAQERAKHQESGSDQDAGYLTEWSARFAWNRQILGEYAIGQVVEQALRICPDRIIEYLLPWFIRAVVTMREPGDRENYPSDPLFSWGWYGEHLSEGATFARWIVGSLQHLARASPSDFRTRAAELATIESLAIQRVLAQAYLSDPETYANDIFEYLMADRRRLDIGDALDGPHYDSCRLYGAAFRCVDSERRAALEQLIMNLRPGWEQKGYRHRGLTQLRFFRSVPSELLSRGTYRRFQELERKFPDLDLRPPQGASFQAVGPPIEQAAQSKMSDEAWLGAMRRYGDATAWGAAREDFAKGGVIELSRAFAEQVKKNPERFYNLAQCFDETISVHYVEEAIAGLADCDAPAEWVFDLVRRFASRIQGESRRGMCHALVKRAKDGVPDDLLDMMTHWALHDPDPTAELWQVPADGGKPYYGGDPHSHGINTNRGVAIQAVCHCALSRTPPQVERAFQLLEQVAGDQSTAVCTCVIDSLGPLLREDSIRTIAIFERVLEGHPYLLQSLLVQRFLYWTYRDHFPRMRPFIEALLDNGDAATRRAGARLVCLAAFQYVEAGALAERAMHGDDAMRQGAAEVYSRNMEFPDLEAICQKCLLLLMHDPDEQVRTHVGDCFQYLHPEQLDHLRPFIDEFLASPSLLAGAEHLVKYLKQLAADEHKLALRVTSCILEVVGKEIVDMRTSRALLEPDLVQLPLIVYTHTDDQTTKSRAMDLFERFLLLGSRTAQRALADWDRR